SGGGTTGVAGTVGSYTLVVATRAYLGSYSVVHAEGNVQVSADDVTTVSMLAGSATVAGGVAGGPSVGVPSVRKGPQAHIRPNATVDGWGNGPAINAPTGEYDVVYGDPTINPGSDVDLTTDSITMKYEHGFSPGQEVVYDAGLNQTPIGGLESGKTYFV